MMPILSALLCLSHLWRVTAGGEGQEIPPCSCGTSDSGGWSGWGPDWKKISSDIRVENTDGDSDQGLSLEQGTSVQAGESSLGSMSHLLCHTLGLRREHRGPGMR